MDNTYNFYGLYSYTVISTKNGKYLNIASFPSSGGFNAAVDYFDDNTEIAYVTTNAIGSTNYAKRVCIIGSDLYTLTFRLIDKYAKTFTRGVLWINKYNTDFLNLPAAINEISTQNDALKIYPNPFSDEIFVSDKNSTDHLNILMFDQLGRSIPVAKQVTNEIITLDTKELSKGLYFVNVSCNGATKHGKLIKY